MKTLFIGTTNPGKIREFQQVLTQLPIVVQNPTSLGVKFDIEETGTSFEENACIKAKGWAEYTHLSTLVDDSGLTIDALNGAPGVYSTRFYPGTDTDRNNQVLKLLKNIPLEKRTARYICVLAFYDPESQLQHTATGTLEGIIAASPTGTNGFGYDPLFIPEGYTQSLGILSSDIKEKISHRAQALAQIMPFLQQWSQSTG